VKAKKEAEKKEIELILGLDDNGVPVPVIAKSFNKTEDEISAIIKKYRK
jgi:hypothetical protein